jgi:hypothetical protein
MPLALSFGAARLRAQQISCSGISTPSVVIPGGQPQSFYYCDGSTSSTPRDVPIHLKNASSLTIVVRGINPLVRSFTVSINGTKYAEVNGSSFLSLLSVPSPTGQAQAAEAQARLESTKRQSQNACLTQYKSAEGAVDDLRDQVNALAALADAYRDKVNKAQNAYLQAIDNLEKNVQSDGSKPSQADFLDQTKTLDLASVQALSTVLSVTSDDVKSNSALASFEGKSYSDVATSISAQALQLNGTLKAPENCSNDAGVKQQISEDNSFLQTLFSPAGSANSKMDQLTSEVNGAAAAATTLATNIASLQQIAMDPSNFEVELRIPPEDRVQTAVVVTVSWTNKPPSSCVSSQASQDSSPASSPTGSAQGQKAARPAGCSTPTQGSTSFTLNFGQGPRTFESAGLVFSPLAQHSYSTAAAGSSAACPSSAAGGCIVDDGGTGWRILPMALATVRFADVPWSQWRTFVPNYFSFGATIKSNSSSGTNLEYLAGLSWASPGQHVFLTAGAYAGEVTQLAGGLSVGPQTVAPTTTLPTSTPYRWGFGFAISYKLGSQGGNGNNVQGQSPAGGTQATTNSPAGPSGASTPPASTN